MLLFNSMLILSVTARTFCEPSRKPWYTRKKMSPSAVAWPHTLKHMCTAAEKLSFRVMSPAGRCESSFKCFMWGFFLVSHSTTCQEKYPCNELQREMMQSACFSQLSAALSERCALQEVVQTLHYKYSMLLFWQDSEDVWRHQQVDRYLRALGWGNRFHSHAKNLNWPKKVGIQFM